MGVSIQRLLKYLVCILPLLLYCGDVYSESGSFRIFDRGQPVFQRLDDERKLTSLNIWAIEQDKHGFIWIGNSTGLLRYDGYEFKQYTPDAKDQHSLPGTNVTNIRSVDENHLWVSTYGTGFSILDLRTEHFSHHLANINVLTIYVDPSNGVWVGTSKGLYLFDFQGNQLQQFTQSDSSGLANNRVFQVLRDTRGRLLIGTGKGLQILDSSWQFTSLLDDEAVYKLYEDKDGIIWAGTESSIIKLTDNGKVETLSLSTEISGIVRFKGNELWLSTMGKGIVVIDPYTLQVKANYRRSTSANYALNSDSPVFLTLDKSGLLWIGHRGKGINIYNSKNRAFRNLYSNHEHPSALSGEYISAILERENGNTWYASYKVAIDVFAQDSSLKSTITPTFAAGDNFKNSKIWDLAATANSDIWVAYGGDGLVHYSTSTGDFSKPFAANNPLAKNVFRLTELQDGQLLIPITQTKQVGIFNPKSRRLTTLAHEGEQASWTHQFAIQNKRGELWLARGSALKWVAADSALIQSLNILDEDGNAFSLNRITGLSLGRNDALFISSDSGVYTVTELNAKANTLVLKPVTAFAKGQGEMFADDTGKLWGGDSLINPDNLFGEALNFADGIGINTLIRYSRMAAKNGVFHFGAADGVLMVNPQLFEPWRFKPDLAITKVFFDGVKRKVNTHEIIEIPNNINSFAFEFAALDYSEPALNQYVYMLEGFHSSWVHAPANRRFASFTNLPPGHYTLKVRGSNRKGVWSDKSINLSINVLPSWYQTWWFRLAILLGVCALLYAFYGYRVKSLKLRHKSLELAVEERTQQVTNALSDLKAAQDSLIESEKHASLGRLIVGVSHELNTPLGVAKMATDQLMNDVQILRDMVSKNAFSKSILTKTNDSIFDASSLAHDNIDKAAALISRFKIISTELYSCELVDIELVGFIQSVIDSFELETSSMKGRIHIYADAPIQITTDKGAISRIFECLLENTQQHAFFDSIETARVEIRLNVEAHFGDDTVVICFMDNGRGIHLEEVPLIFDPFYTTSRDTGCMGLGLHIVFNTVTQSLKGTVECVSSLGHGTQFVICLPLSHENAPNVQTIKEMDEDYVLYESKNNDEPT